MWVDVRTGALTQTQYVSEMVRRTGSMIYPNDHSVRNPTINPQMISSKRTKRCFTYEPIISIGRSLARSHIRYSIYTTQTHVCSHSCSYCVHVCVYYNNNNNNICSTHYEHVERFVRAHHHTHVCVCKWINRSKNGAKRTEKTRQNRHSYTRCRSYAHCKWKRKKKKRPHSYVTQSAVLAPAAAAATAAATMTTNTANIQPGSQPTNPTNHAASQHKAQKSLQWAVAFVFSWKENGIQSCYGLVGCCIKRRFNVFFFYFTLLLFFSSLQWYHMKKFGVLCTFLFRLRFFFYFYFNFFFVLFKIKPFFGPFFLVSFRLVWWFFSKCFGLTVLIGVATNWKEANRNLLMWSDVIWCASQLTNSLNWTVHGYSSEMIFMSTWLFLRFTFSRFSFICFVLLNLSEREKKTA